MFRMLFMIFQPWNGWIPATRAFTSPRESISQHHAIWQRPFRDFTACIYAQQSVREAYVHRAEIRTIVGDIPGAIEDYSVLLRLNPNDITILMIIARFYQTELKMMMPVNTYTLILQIDPYKAEAYYGRGLAKLNKRIETAANADMQGFRAWLFSRKCGIKRIRQIKSGLENASGWHNIEV